MRLALLFAALAVAGCAPSQPTAPAERSTPAPSAYSALLPQIRAAVEASYYAPAEFSEARWSQFWADLERGLGAAETGREARQSLLDASAALGVSHFDLTRPGAAPATEARPPVGLDLGDDGVAVLHVDAFSVEETMRPVVEAFHAIAAAAPRALVLDLRQNPGGDVSSMLLAGHLIEQPAPAGLFLSRQWWAAHDAVPAPDAWAGLPLLTSPDMDAFLGALETEGALVGIVPPMEPRYDGPVYVLTSRRTASASEPLVHLLKAQGRAILVGETTAGAMVSSDQTELADGWVLQHPVADYYTAEGTRLDQIGVTPDVAVPAADALDVARRLALE